MKKVLELDKQLGNQYNLFSEIDFLVDKETSLEFGRKHVPMPTGDYFVHIQRKQEDKIGILYHLDIEGLMLTLKRNPDPVYLQVFVRDKTSAQRHLNDDQLKKLKAQYWLAKEAE